MNSSYIIDMTLLWLYSKEQDATFSSRILSYFLQPTGGKTLLHPAVPVDNLEGVLHTYNLEKEGSNLNLHKSHSDSQMVTPDEVETLTQIILHTLNSNPERFHDMAEIPGLETKECMQRMELARYLLKMGLVEATSKDTNLFIKLTIKGSMYLRSHDSAA